MAAAAVTAAGEIDEILASWAEGLDITPEKLLDILGLPQGTRSSQIKVEGKLFLQKASIARSEFNLTPPETKNDLVSLQTIFDKATTFAIFPVTRADIANFVKLDHGEQDYYSIQQVTESLDKPELQLFVKLKRIPAALEEAAQRIGFGTTSDSLAYALATNKGPLGELPFDKIPVGTTQDQLVRLLDRFKSPNDILTDILTVRGGAELQTIGNGNILPSERDYLNINL